MKKIDFDSFFKLIDPELYGNTPEELQARARLYFDRKTEAEATEAVIKGMTAAQHIMLAFKINEAWKQVYFTEEGFLQAVSKFGLIDIEKYLTGIETAISDSDFERAMMQAVIQQEERKPDSLAVYPEKYKLSTDKVTEMFFEKKLISDGEAQPIGIGKNGVNPFTYVTIYPDEAERNISVPQETTPFDYVVLNALINSQLAGNTWTNANQIYYILTGQTTAKPYQAIKDKIEASLNFLMSHKMKIDYTEAYETIYKKKLSKNGVQKAIMEGMIAPLEKATIKLVNGDTITGYRFTDARLPILYRYNEMLNHITTIENKAARRLPDNVKFTEENLALQTFLFRQIEWIKGGKRGSNKILFNGVFKACSMTNLIDVDETGKKKTLAESDRKQAQRYKKRICEFCEHFKETGYISDFTRTKDGVEIDVSRRILSG